jgi:tRNA(fMet)-specific endonuclease VapC
MYLLDTDTLTHLHAGHERVAENLQRVEDDEVGTTIVNRIEILRARYDFVLKAADGKQLLRAQEWLFRSEELLADVLILPFDDAAAAEFDRLRSDRRARSIGRADLLIASIALAQRATLVTRNLKHFQRVSGLRTVNWVD